MAKLKSGPSSQPDENEFVFGYPTRICDHAPGNKYLCCNCNNVLKKAQQTLCGHRYCAPCLAWIIRNHKSPICPKCKQEDPGTLSEESYLSEDRAFSDAAINKEISELRVHCVTASCSWSGVLRDYEDHQSLCDFAQILCHTGCGGTVQRRHLADHLETECTNNTTVCPKCSLRMSSTDFPKHKCEKCSLEDQMPKKNGMVAKAKNQNSANNSWKEKCRFSALGCTYKGSRDKVKEHEKSSVVAHLSLVAPVLLQIKESLSLAEPAENGFHYPLQDCTTRTVRKVFSNLQNGEVKALNGNIAADCGCLNGGNSAGADPLSRLAILEARTQVFENIIAVLNREMDNANAKLVAALQQKNEEQQKVKACEQKITDLRCTLAAKEMALNEFHMRLSTLEQTSYNGVFQWKICNFTQKCHDAVIGRAMSLYSPAFYTAKYGYKVCLRIYLNGDGAGKGTHVSLFFAIMKGEYDALLPWPFKHKVTFMLLDQSNREHVLDAFRPDVSSASFQRPVNDMNIASGCPLFCPLSKLQSSKNNYVKDDTLFIRCIIDTSS
ncbi:PREDICTED: TNF receptor-associated factor 1 [Nanorana parkeri]|uniref:TNF receptor-associated factor 1 n=1 Tax=Nanorana parkeri TaxID=125878 RepID=UPI000853F893|nr:PREDICTED: TNF receptor-associated factor 1 [Nanorana parkeri]